MALETRNLVYAAPTPDKGCGVFAKMDIPMRWLIFAEEPLLEIPAENKITDIFEAFDALDREEQAKYLRLSHHKLLLGPEEDSENVQHYYGRSRQSASSSPLRYRCLRSIFQANTFRSYPPEDYFGLGSLSKQIQKPQPTSNVFYKMSHINHSCIPNAYFVQDKGVFQDPKQIEPSCGFVFARVKIAAGEEITISYLGPQIISNGVERRRLLKEMWGFDCRCALCNVSDTEAEDGAQQSLEEGGEADRGRTVGPSAPALRKTCEFCCEALVEIQKPSRDSSEDRPKIGRVQVLKDQIKRSWNRSIRRRRG